MEEKVLALGEVVDEVAVTEVAFDQLHPPTGEGFVQVCASAADEVVQHVYVFRTGVKQLVNQRRSNGAGASGDQDTRPWKLFHRATWRETSFPATIVDCPSVLRLCVTASRTDKTRSPDSPLVRGMVRLRMEEASSHTTWPRGSRSCNAGDQVSPKR
ncbi:hypothetical protein D3C73_1241220 [compost metagenome]